jgi:MYXO-CTERM domain-containing protein
MSKRGWHWLHAGLALQLGVLGHASTARAHGVWGHVHVTGWAIENLPPCELREFFAQEEVRQAAQFGAAYTDSGYSIAMRRDIAMQFPLVGATDAEVKDGHDYSEHTHWEPFIEGMIDWIRANDPPPWNTIEQQKRVAFVLGAASHGLQDEIFDSTFLYQAELHDGRSQEATDPGTDYLLNEQGYLRFHPPKYVPMEAVRAVYAQLEPGRDFPESLIQKGVDTVGDFYLSENPVIHGIIVGVVSNGDGNPANIPWSKDNYMNPDVPGALIAEIVPTAAHMMALWKRLHGEHDPNDAVVHAYPGAPRRLRSHDHTVPDSWVTLIFGEGPSFADAMLSLTDASGAAVPFEKGNTRWNAQHPRLVHLRPSQPLVPGAWYEAGLSAATFIGGGALTQPFSFKFQVACVDDAADCADLGDIPVPSTDGSGPPPGLWPEEEPDAGDGDGDGEGVDDGEGEGDGDGDGSSDGGSSDDDVGADGDDGSADPAPRKPRKPRSKGCAVTNTPQGESAALALLALTVVLARRRRGHG